MRRLSGYKEDIGVYWDLVIRRPLCSDVLISEKSTQIFAEKFTLFTKSKFT